MKVGILTKHIVTNILLENRVTDIKKKYPQLDPKIIDFFVQRDPSGNNKYLEWEVKALMHKPTTDSVMENINDRSWLEGYWGPVATYIADLVDNFHLLLPYMVQNNEGTTDLYAYKFTDGEMINYLAFDIQNAKERRKSKTELKEARKNSDKIYGDSNWLVVRTKTWEASCVYGSGTKWCTTSKNSDSHFKRETERKFLIYVIDKNKNSTDVTYKVAWQIPYLKDYSKIIYDDGTINTSKVKLWNAEDDNFARSSSAYIEEVPLEVKMKIRNYMQNQMDTIFSNMGFSEDPKIQALVDSLGLTQEEVDNIEISNYSHYGMPIYIIEDHSTGYAVADNDEVELAKVDWATGYLDDLGYEEIFQMMGNSEQYVTINNINGIASDYADSRIEDLSDEDVIDEALRYSKNLREKAEEYEINKGIFESNEEEIDELESKDGLTEEESQELEDLKLENSELNQDLNRDFKYIRDTLRDEYYDYEYSRMSDDPMDWLWEMGYYSKKDGFDRSVFRSGLISIDEEQLIQDLAEDQEFDYFDEMGNYSSIDVDGETYYIFRVSV